MLRYKKYKEAKNIINDINNKSENYLIVHYSCESFIDKQDGSTPRITSIAVRYFSSSQTKSFSIHKIAEQKHIGVEKIEESYDLCEKQMLKDFFAFAETHMNFIWIHWNMRDENYGFYAIENRYKVLGGAPKSVPDDKKIDLSRLLVNRYGKYYIQNPKMAKLVEKNRMTTLDFLNGKEEADAFINKEYIKLHKSTLRKVDLFSSIINASGENILKTDSKWKDTYGISVQGIFEVCKDSFWFFIFSNFLFLIIGTLIGRLFN